MAFQLPNHRFQDQAQGPEACGPRALKITVAVSSPTTTCQVRTFQWDFLAAFDVLKIQEEKKTKYTV